MPEEIAGEALWVERMVDCVKGGADDVWLDHGEMIG